MRITRIIPLLSLLAVAGCSRATAAAVDPNDDFDCAIITGVFREAAKLDSNAPDRARQGLFVVNQWYAARWSHHHPEGVDAKLREHEVAMAKAIGKDGLSYRDSLKTCVQRAVADPKFERFSQLMQEGAPDAR